MRLYHASKHKFDVLKRQHASVPEDVIVPATELQNKIYLTPDFGFALAMAAGPYGVTKVDYGKISFEHQERFDPTQSIYVYEVTSDDIAPELLEKIDERQYAADVDELTPILAQKYTAGDVFSYYELVDWK